MTIGRRVRRPDAVARRLVSLADRYRAQLTGVAVVGGSAVPGAVGATLTPDRGGAVGVGWADLGDRLEVQVLAPGGGGRFVTAGRTPQDTALLERLVDAVVAGRARQISAHGRSRVELTLDTGPVTDADHDADGPRWPRRVTRTDFRAYRERTPLGSRRR